ncbi:hypothetical protein CEXT_669171 [Caerostris extrusa]|uniref:Ribosomal protein S10 n=1 Tax=Caerostris extrusa TaxID=172846 RepID=A0AAV4SZB0_CAEEX|nr:hypothetical protein CEXT_669171 [Caerostris extrusa]
MLGKCKLKSPKVPPKDLKQTIAFFTIAISETAHDKRSLFINRSLSLLPLPVGTESTLNFDRLVCRNEGNLRGAEGGAEEVEDYFHTSFRIQKEERRVNSQGKGIQPNRLNVPTIAISGNSPRQEIIFHPRSLFSHPLPQGHGTKSTLNFDRLVAGMRGIPEGEREDDAEVEED